jgi:hypothetical protein
VASIRKRMDQKTVLGADFGQTFEKVVILAVIQK